MNTQDTNTQEVINEAVSLITPSGEEKKDAQEAEKELKKRLDKTISTPLRYRFLGSYARGTWLRGSLEIDIFILFPEETSMQELETKGLEVGKAVVDEVELRYAAHPYVHGKVKGTEIDVVPCYSLKTPEKIKSAVDRTPFHHDWLIERIKGKENDVRLLKKFLKTSNLYGAEYSVKGFSGYLCELLVIFYGSFEKTVDQCRNLTRDTVIDVEKEEISKRKGQENLLVLDPVDKNRNVAANLSLDKLAEFVEKCRAFMENPSIDFFIKEEIKPPDDDTLKREIDHRRTGLCLIEFGKPDIVEDNLYTQLDRACRKIHQHLSRRKFMPLRSSYFVKEGTCYLIFETEVSELSAIQKKMGPPFESYKNVKKFKSKNQEYEPFIEEGRYYAYMGRDNFTLEDAISEYVERQRESLGKNISETIGNFSLYSGKDVLEINGDFRVFLTGFFGLE